MGRGSDEVQNVLVGETSGKTDYENRFGGNLANVKQGGRDEAERV